MTAAAIDAEYYEAVAKQSIALESFRSKLYLRVGGG